MFTKGALKSYFMQLWGKGAFHIFLGSFFSKFVAFFGSIFLVKVLSKNHYGQLGYIENIYGYIYIFAGMGLGNALLRYVILGKSSSEKYGYYKYAVMRGTSFNILLILIVGIGALYYPHPDGFESSKWMILIFLFALPFQYLMDSNQLTYRAMLDNKRFAIIAFITSTTLVLGRFIGAVFFELNGVVLANFIFTLFFGISLTLVIIYQYFKRCQSYILTIGEKRKVNKYSVQYMITNGIWAVFMLNDIFLLGQLTRNAEMVADYKVAYVIPGNLSIISSAIGIFIGPYFIKHEKDSSWVWKHYKKVILIITGIIGIIVGIVLILSTPIINLLYGEQYSNIVPIMRLLLIASLINSGLRYTTAHLLASMGQIKYNMIISIIGVIFQIVINIIFIPIYGAIGAAITSIVVFAFMALSLFIVFIKKYKYSIN